MDTKTGTAGIQRIDTETLFKKLGFHPADEGPILAGWQEANAQWRRDRLRRVALHAQRVQDHLRRFAHTDTSPIARSRAAMGRPRAVWCVELQRCFRTLSDAAAFVQRKPSNISQSLKRGVRCGPYHWEPYIEGKVARSA